MKQNPKISILVPIFKVEEFIANCVRSLMEQTLEDVEYIFVDDASPDRSIEVLKETIAQYPHRVPQCEILTHEKNKGLPAARNTALEVARGEFIFHCDSDDWVEPTMMEEMYNAAVEADADIVWSDFFISFEHNERYMKARPYKTADDLIRKGYLAGDMKYNVWNKIVHRSLYEGIRFPEGHSMGEDMTMILLAAKADKVAYVPKGFYHYLKLNGNALTQVMSEKSLADMRFNTDRVESYLKATYPGKYDKDLNLFKLNVKLPFIISDSKEDYRRWKEWFPEANKYAFANSELPFRTNLLQWMAAHNCWAYVWLYYKFVYKFIYGVVFK